MEYLVKGLEFYGMLASMTGAYLMSRDHVRFTNTMYLAFISFMTSNLALFYVAMVTGLIPLMVQLVLFFVSAAVVIIAHSKNVGRDRNILIAITSTYIVLMTIIFIQSNIVFDFKIGVLDTMAAIIAISGSFAMKSHDNAVKLWAFAAFFVADVFYVYIGFENELFFFMTQSFFFLYTSIAGANNVLKNMKLVKVTA